MLPTEGNVNGDYWLQYDESYSWSIVIQNFSPIAYQNSRKLKKLYALHSSIRAHWCKRIYALSITL